MDGYTEKECQGSVLPNAVQGGGFKPSSLWGSYSHPSSTGKPMATLKGMSWPSTK